MVFPVGVKGSIIGKGGSTIREIEEKSGATVKVSGTFDVNHVLHYCNSRWRTTAPSSAR